MAELLSPGSCSDNILQEFEANHNPVEAMNILRAVQWGIQTGDLMSLQRPLRTALGRLLTLKSHIKSP